MRIASLVKVASLAVAISASLGSVAFAHANDIWRDNGDLHKVTTTYYQPDPALVRLERRVERADMAHQTRQALSAEHVARLQASDLG